MDDWMIELSQNIALASEWQKIGLLGVSTFVVSEDLTTIAAGMLISQDVLSVSTAFWGCFLGIFLGDGLLYLIGLVLGRPAMKLPILRRLLTPEKVAECEAWFARNGIQVVIMSRFLPGTRLPTYFAAGVMRSRASFFMLAAAIATAIWTPLLLGASWFFGDRLSALFTQLGAHPWIVVPLSFAILIVVFQGFSKLTNWRWRRRFRSRLHRIMRWEFWPIGVLYLPIFVQNLWLAIKYRRLTLPLLCNPSIEFGGIVGESKSEVLDLYKKPHRFIPSYRVLLAGTVESRIAQTLEWMEEGGLTFPIILKPDAGQRGYGVRLIRNATDMHDYLQLVPIPTIAQAYAHGPYEFGVYYVRRPGEERGVVAGITGKEFPKLVGDGTTNIEDLILRLPAAQGRIHIFTNRFKDRLNEVLVRGETLALVHAGNHCQGTIFLDHTHLITPQLEERIDLITREIEGLHICRIDIRAKNLEAFRSGECFQMVEINGATAEPSHMYDPRHGLFNAWRQLMKHWSNVWYIGHLNRLAGEPTPKLSDFIASIKRYRKNTRYHLDAN